MKIKPYVRKVNYYETDKMSIVHHSNYIRYFEEARIDFMSQINCDCAMLESMGLIIPNVDAYARYHKSLKFGDEFSINVKLTQFTGARLRLEYELYNTADNSLCTTGATTHCFVNEDYRPITVRKANPEIYERMKCYLEKSDK